LRVRYCLPERPLTLFDLSPMRVPWRGRMFILKVPVLVFFGVTELAPTLLSGPWLVASGRHKDLSAPGPLLPIFRITTHWLLPCADFRSWYFRLGGLNGVSVFPRFFFFFVSPPRPLRGLSVSKGRILDPRPGVVAAFPLTIARMGCISVEDPLLVFAPIGRPFLL